MNSLPIWKQEMRRNLNEETKEIQPNSRIYPLGTGELPPKMNQFEYMNLVYDCTLTQKMTHVLGYLAIRYSFKERRATMMGQRRAANDLKMGRSTFRLATKDLEKWGWVSIKKGSRNKTDRYTLLIGYEIPDQKWIEPEAKLAQIQNEQEESENKK
jgi:hypothetical protein